MIFVINTALLYDVIHQLTCQKQLNTKHNYNQTMF